jgi:hypothetical protein
MGEVEVPSGEHDRSANACDDEEDPLPGGRDRLSIGGEEGQDEPGCLYENGAQDDGMSDLSSSQEQSPTEASEP